MTNRPNVVVFDVLETLLNLDPVSYTHLRAHETS
mgnify:CR=1 FL=1